MWVHKELDFQVSQENLKLDCGLSLGEKQNEMSNTEWSLSRVRWSSEKNAACHILRGKLLPSADSGNEVTRVQFVGRTKYEASWNWSAGQLPMLCEIRIYGFIRASKRCAELRDVLDGMKIAMQFSSLCFCLLLVSVPPYWTLPFCWSCGKHHFPSTLPAYKPLSLSTCFLKD